MSECVWARKCTVMDVFSCGTISTSFLPSWLPADACWHCIQYTSMHLRLGLSPQGKLCTRSHQLIKLETGVHVTFLQFWGVRKEKIISCVCLCVCMRVYHEGRICLRHNFYKCRLPADACQRCILYTYKHLRLRSSLHSNLRIQLHQLIEVETSVHVMFRRPQPMIFFSNRGVVTKWAYYIDWSSSTWYGPFVQLSKYCFYCPLANKRW